MHLYHSPPPPRHFAMASNNITNIVTINIIQIVTTIVTRIVTRVFTPYTTVTTTPPSTSASSHLSSPTCLHERSSCTIILIILNLNLFVYLLCRGPHCHSSRRNTCHENTRTRRRGTPHCTAIRCFLATCLWIFSATTASNRIC